MLLKFRALVRHSEHRLRTGRWILAQRRQTLQMEQTQQESLSNELKLQLQLLQAGPIDGTEMSRQQLFSWLRKTSADQHRTQDLRLNLRCKEEAIDDCSREVEAQRVRCLQLEMRRQRHENRLKETIRKKRSRQTDIDDNEMEEHLSWFNV